MDVPFDRERNAAEAFQSDVMNVLQVPFVHELFTVLKGYDQFLAVGWREVRQNLLTYEWKRGSDRLRHPEIDANIPVIDWGTYYKRPVIAKIRSVVDTFNFVNPKLLLLTTAWYESLAGRGARGTGKTKGTIKPGFVKNTGELENVDLLDVPEPIRSLLEEIASRHGHHQPAVDYRALSRFPQFLRTCWVHLRDYVPSRNYHELRAQLLSEASEQLNHLPHPVDITVNKLAAEHEPVQIAGMIGIVSLYRNMLADCLIDGEYFRRILIS
ncbi:MAG TPA: halocarboxylic acid dehydrogenase DehI family protein [Bacillales bacterium]|nr:halocarboxylic acid dehydrogenase DehI family protein [Bacillales bacterium]